jgi:hypothetical protein
MLKQPAPFMVVNALVCGIIAGGPGRPGGEFSALDAARSGALRRDLDHPR